MTGSIQKILVVPVMSETAVRDAITNDPHMISESTSSVESINLGSTKIEGNDRLHSGTEPSGKRKGHRRGRISIFHTLRRQLTKIVSHNFHATQQRDKRQEVRPDVMDKNNFPDCDGRLTTVELKRFSGCNDTNDAHLHADDGGGGGGANNRSCNRTDEIGSDEDDRFQVAPAVYQDPYCAVTVDRKVQIYKYYLQDEIDFPVDSRLCYYKRSTRTVYTNDIVTVFHNENAGQITDDSCRSWGLDRNSVWWAADPQRKNDTGKEKCTVVLQLKDHPILIGLTVIKLVAFTDALKICGLNKDCQFIPMLPAMSQTGISRISIDEKIQANDSSDEAMFKVFRYSFHIPNPECWNIFPRRLFEIFGVN